VVLGRFSSAWFNAVLDARNGAVELAEGANIQDNCRVEGLPGQAAFIGRGVSLGHNARVIGAVVGDHALIAIGSSVLPGARIGARCIVGANAVVPEGMQVPPRSLVIGHGRILREVTEAEIERILFGGKEYQRLAAIYRARLGPAPRRRQFVDPPG
jgi:carbonic anhydrase/acetyltransferase-like protein (isoleucine patch superfamily)